jgi:TPR repeat protein
MVKRILAGVILAFILTGGAVAGPFEEADAAYQRGDYATALRLWRPLAAQGNAGAQFALGKMYVHGHGVPQDDAEALKWYRLAVEQGNADAQSNLGVMCLMGQGVPQDYVEAHKCFNLAASRFSASDAENRDKAVQARDSLASQMTPEQLAEAQKLAREWRLVATKYLGNLGHLWCCGNLSRPGRACATE